MNQSTTIIQLKPVLEELYDAFLEDYAINRNKKRNPHLKDLAAQLKKDTCLVFSLTLCLIILAQNIMLRRFTNSYSNYAALMSHQSNILMTIRI